MSRWRRGVALVTILSVLVPLVPAAPAAASPGALTAYDSGGFEAAVPGSVHNQSFGTWHPGAGAKRWSVTSGDPAIDGGEIVNVGGSHGKVLSFRANGRWSHTRLLMSWGHTTVANHGQPLAVRWELDFYETGGANGSIIANRNTQQVEQVAILPVRGTLRAEARHPTASSDYWPSHPLTSYATRVWHRLVVQQNYGYAEQQGELHVYLDDVEVTPGHNWWTVWNGWSGWISDLLFNQMVDPGHALYVDNLTVRTGLWAEVSSGPLDRVQVYNSDGFNRFGLGSVGNQRKGTWYLPSATRGWVVPGTASQGGQIQDLGGRDGKALSFPPRPGVYPDTVLRTGWTGAYAGSPSVVRLDFRFRQSAGVYGAVETRRNAGQVTQAKVGLENGVLELFGRAGSTTAPIATHALGNYSLGQWHRVAIEQHQPAGEGMARIKVFLDGVERTAGQIYYAQWVGWPGWIDEVHIYPQVPADGFYHLDDLSVMEGPVMNGPPSHQNWLWHWGTDVARQQGWSNLAIANNLSEVSQAGVGRMASLVNVSSAFFIETYNGSTWWGYALRPDYQRSWDVLADLVRPHLESGRVLGFEMGDELYWVGLSEAQIETAVNTVRATFPDAKIYYNEAYAPLANGANIFCDTPTHPRCSTTGYGPSIPAELDWFSVDTYDRWVPVKQRYEESVFPKLRNQRATIVPPAFSSDHHPSMTRDQVTGQSMNDASQFWFNWSLQDSRLIGVDPYHWTTVPLDRAVYNEIGIESLPNLEAVWTAIGRQIVQNNPRPRYGAFFPTQRFDDLPHGMPLPSTLSGDPWRSVPGQPNTPIAPDPAHFWFTRADAFSQPTSIRAQSGSQGQAFRYTQSVNRNIGLDSTNFRKFYVDFRVKADTLADLSLEALPIKGWGSPAGVKVASNGVSYRDATGDHVVAPPTILTAGKYHRITFYVDIDTRQLTIWVNESEKYRGPYAPISANQPVNSIQFHLMAGSAYVDDVGIGSDPPFS